MLVTVWGPNIGHGGEFHVHKPGCRDTLRGQYLRAERPWTMNTNSFKHIVEDIYCDILPENPGSTWEDYADTVKIFPCVTLDKA